MKWAVIVFATLLWASEAMDNYPVHETRSSRRLASGNLVRSKLVMQESGTALKLRGGIGEAMDGDARPSRAISDALETFESFGQGPTSLDQSSSRFEAKPDYFNQSENRMDGKMCIFFVTTCISRMILLGSHNPDAYGSNAGETAYEKLRP